MTDGLRAARFVLPEGERHAFRWEPARGRYQCAHCRRCVARLPRPGNRCLRAHPALRAIRAEALALGHSVHLCAVQGRMAGILAICVACGSYGQERCHRLRRPGLGVLSFRAFSVRAVSQGRHPHCRASFVERVWVAGPGHGQPAVPAAAAEPRSGPPPRPPREPGSPPPLAAAALAAGDEADEWSLEDLLAWHGGGLDDPP